jgi:hypothetical protein
MTETENKSVTLLNHLYAAEARSLFIRLAETSPFTDDAHLATLTHVQTIIADQSEHLAWLDQTIQTCGGALHPVAPDASTGWMHYLKVDALLARLIEDKVKLTQLYADARQQNQLNPPVAELITRIHHRHEHHLQLLKEL